MAGLRRLVINADDFGLSEGVNRGIVEAHAMGSVTSASLLVNLPAFDDAVRRACQASTLGVGLHFNLTAGSPLSPRGAVPSLCDRRTARFRQLPTLVARALAGRINPTEVAVECDAQIRRIREAGLRITHLDSHRHVHLLPGIWKPVMETARRAGIGIVRVPLERLGRVAKHLGAAAEQTLLRVAYRMAGANGTQRSVDHFYGSSLFGRPDFREELLKLLDRLEPGSTELMVHPGYQNAQIGLWDSYTWPRERELRALTDASVCLRLQRGDIELVHFGTLVPPTRRAASRGAPRFSVVIPAFNEVKYLPRLLDSIAVARAAYSSDPDAVEVIVADNRSTDRTANIGRERGCRVVTEPKRVIAAARNAGAATARGAVLAFVDADSQVHPNTFVAIETALGSNVVGGATGVTMDRWTGAIGVTFMFLRLWCWLSGWDTGVVFCRRADFVTVGGFDESLLFAEDLAFYRFLRRLGRARGQGFARLRGVRTVTSTRKFEQFGEVRWPLANLRVVCLAALRSPRARRLIEDYWYKVRS